MTTLIPSDLMMIGPVARELDVSVQTLRIWDREGKLKATRTTSGVRLYRREDVERLKAQRLRAQETAHV